MAVILPKISASVIADARAVWNQTIEHYGRDVHLLDMDGTLDKSVKAFAKRPKILGLFDRSQGSYDQEKYMLLLRADDFLQGPRPEKFMRANWDGEDHVFLSVTEVDLSGVVFGYRVMVKG